MPKLLLRNYFWLLMLYLLSCKKGEEVLPEEEFEGVLLEAVSGKPIGGYPIHLTIYRQVISPEKDPEFPAGKPVMETSQQQTVSATDGKYKFRFPVHSNTAFYITVPNNVLSC